MGILGKREQKASLSGFTVWGFGIKWDFSDTEFKHIRDLFVFLENCRVLYDPYEAESPQAVIDSVERIRATLGTTMTALAQTSKAAPLLRAMQKSCRDLLRLIQPQVVGGTLGHASTQRMLFDERLGAFRGVFLIYAAVLSRSVGVEVHGELKAAMPDID